jgi:DmsE family decaheme c-type cytochrome
VGPAGFITAAVLASGLAAHSSGVGESNPRADPDRGNGTPTAFAHSGAGAGADSAFTHRSTPPRGDPDYLKYSQISGAESLGSGKCAECHAEATELYRRTTHSTVDVECEDCHGAGSLHAVAPDDYTKILRLPAQPAETANGICLRCHAPESRFAGWPSGKHSEHDVRCIECHAAHGKETSLKSRRQSTDACTRCHHQQAAEGSLPYHHPVHESEMGCTDCHDPHSGSGTGNLKAESVGELCFTCHAELAGPFTYEHPPVTESCLKCHSPHGSAQPHLLTVSEPMLCLQCHAGHHNGSGVPLLNPCTNCHNSIHGSDIPSATGGCVFIDKGK